MNRTEFLEIPVINAVGVNQTLGEAIGFGTARAPQYLIIIQGYAWCPSCKNAPARFASEISELDVFDQGASVQILYYSQRDREDQAARLDPQTENLIQRNATLVFSSDIQQAGITNLQSVLGYEGNFIPRSSLVDLGQASTPNASILTSDPGIPYPEAITRLEGSGTVEQRASIFAAVSGDRQSPEPIPLTAIDQAERVIQNLMESISTGQMNCEDFKDQRFRARFFNEVYLGRGTKPDLQNQIDSIDAIEATEEFKRKVKSLVSMLGSGSLQMGSTPTDLIVRGDDPADWRFRFPPILGLSPDAADDVNREIINNDLPGDFFEAWPRNEPSDAEYKAQVLTAFQSYWERIADVMLNPTQRRRLPAEARVCAGESLDPPAVDFPTVPTRSNGAILFIAGATIAAYFIYKK